MKSSAIVHEYYKRAFDDYLVLVQVNPINYTGLELIVHPDGKLEKTKMEFDEHIKEDLEHDDFEQSSSLEFNLYLKGLKK
ncbi:hypothetical protein GCM10027429_28170 [Marivirga atlantica]|jgi:hypothetical protein|uniref:Uncharacterized protein n=1 Tax=Marivirga atlantica TaxID=1548457 RepID=A0A937AJ21_9BACT|nr:hypothetical protein [Marivirga atlantica]MBL0766419.1 hypothetical protein [Marivirga atlantica]